MTEKLLMGMTAASCLGLMAGHLLQARGLSDGLALLAVGSLGACLSRRGQRGGAGTGQREP